MIPYHFRFLRVEKNWAVFHAYKLFRTRIQRRKEKHYNCNCSCTNRMVGIAESMKNVNSKETDEQRKEQEHSSVLLDLIRGNPVFVEYIERNYLQDRGRIELLQEIFLAMEENRRDETEQKIYLYGSLLHEQDLIARQIFLWLLGLEAEKKSSRITKEEYR